MKNLIGLLLVVSFLNSCISNPTIETSRLVMNEAKGEFFLEGKAISEEKAQEHLENAKPDEVVVIVEGNGVGIYTVAEIEEFMSSLFSSFFTRQKLHGDPLAPKIAN